MAFTSLVMCHSLIELSQFSQFFFCEHKELLLLLGIWLNMYMLGWKCMPTLFLVSPVILYVYVLPASYLSLSLLSFTARYFSPMKQPAEQKLTRK